MTTVPPTTTDAGIRVRSDDHSLTVGRDGPIVLHDHYLLEQIANFNRERIPERHEAIEDVSRYTQAKVFPPGVKTGLPEGGGRPAEKSQ